MGQYQTRVSKREGDEDAVVTVTEASTGEQVGTKQGLPIPGSQDKVTVQASLFDSLASKFLVLILNWSKIYS